MNRVICFTKAILPDLTEFAKKLIREEFEVVICLEE